MEAKQAGNILRDIFAGDDTPVRELFETQLASQPAITQPLDFLPATMLVFPQSYLNRRGRRVDICGVVDSNTKEYEEGWRFFSTEDELFKRDGTQADASGPDDLCSLLPLADVNQYAKPITPFIWVHPQHCVMKSFFNQLVPGKAIVVKGSHYLNRKGFAVEIVREEKSATNVSIYYDDQGVCYEQNGAVCNLSSSMADLVYEVKSWSFFVKSDWSTDRVQTLEESTEHIPELFNPEIEDRHTLMSSFLEHILKAHAISKKLNIEFGFHTKTD